MIQDTMVQVEIIRLYMWDLNRRIVSNDTSQNDLIRRTKVKLPLVLMRWYSRMNLSYN